MQCYWRALLWLYADRLQEPPSLARWPEAQKAQLRVRVRVRVRVRLGLPLGLGLGLANPNPNPNPNPTLRRHAATRARGGTRTARRALPRACAGAASAQGGGGATRPPCARRCGVSRRNSPRRRPGRASPRLLSGARRCSDFCRAGRGAGVTERKFISSAFHSRSHHTSLCTH